MNKLKDIWKICKEIGLVVMFVGSAVFAYGEYTAEEAIHDKDMSIEYTSLKEDNKILLSEIKCIKSEVKVIKNDYRILKLKLFKSNIIDEFGGFVNSDIPKPKKPRKRIALKEFIVSFKEDGFLNFLE